MLQVGVAKVEITPPLGVPCSLGLDDACELVLDTPYIRAIALSDGVMAICLLAADVIGLQQQTLADLRQAVSRATGLPPEAIIAHATHSHEAPSVHIALNKELEPYGLQYTDPAYYQSFLRSVAEAAQAALGNMFSAKLAWGRGQVMGVASNRRIVDEDGRVSMRWSNSNAELRDYPEGNIDPWVRLLLLQESNGPRQALILNYCCHPTAAGGDEERYVTGDFPGEAMRLLEMERQGRSCLYFTGPCGNINPGKYTGDAGTVEDRVRDVHRLGSRLADGVHLALAAVEPMDADSLRLTREVVTLPVRQEMLPAEQLRAHLDEAVQRYREAKLANKRLPGGGDIRRLAHKSAFLRLAKGGAIPTEVVAMGIGSAAICFLPGECFLELAQSLWGRFPHLNLQIVAPTDYSISYVPTPEAYRLGGYEAEVANVGPEAFGILLEAATQALQRLYPETVCLR